jgi:hypothetical protein
VNSEERITALERWVAKASVKIELLEFKLFHALTELHSAEQTAIDALAGRLDSLKRIGQHMYRRDEFRRIRDGARSVAATPRRKPVSLPLQPNANRRN